MQQFSIKAMERLSGIKAHTLRIWEQRYGIIRPARKEGNHRFYTNDDLKTLLRVVYLYQRGHRIGEIAKLGQSDIQELLRKQPANGGTAKAYLPLLIEAVVDFDEEAMDSIFYSNCRQFGFTGTMLEVVFPLLNNLGVLWMSERLTPGQEHFASQYFLRKILNAQNEIEKSPIVQNSLVMLFAPKGEFHELGLLFMGYLLRLNGHRTVYIGANADEETVNLFYQRVKPTHLYVYLTGNLQEEEPAEYLQKIKSRFSGACVAAGGMVLREIGDIPGCTLLRTDEAMMHFSKCLTDEGG